MIVLDASAAVELLLQTPKAAMLEGRLASEAEDARVWHTPHLLDVEVAHVFRRYVAAGSMSAERGERALQVLRDLPIVRYAHYPLLERIWQLRHNLSAYDAVYVALAEALNASLVTCDNKIVTATGHHALIEVV